MLTLLEVVTGCLLAGWIVYPVAVCVVGSLRGAGRGRAGRDGAGVSLLIATRDSVEAVRARVSNIMALRHEVRSLEIIVAVDHAARSRTDQYRAALGSEVLLVAGDPPGGKAATLNAAVRAASGDILIFADSAQQFLPGAIRALVAKLDEPGVGASTGVLEALNNSRSLFLRTFWSYELWLRRSESRAGSIVAVTGAIYALRRKLWDPLPAGLICDDLYVPLKVIRQGFRVVSCDAAVAVDPRVFRPRQEFDRKVRTLTGMLQMCVLCPSVLNPFGNRAWLQFVFHKLLRIATPALIAAALLAGLACISPTVRFEVLGIAAGAVAVLLLLRQRLRLAARVSRQIGWLLLFLCAPFIAVANALRGKWDVWSGPGDDGPTRDTGVA